MVHPNPTSLQHQTTIICQRDPTKCPLLRKEYLEYFESLIQEHNVQCASCSIYSCIKKLGDNLYNIFNLLDKEAAAFCINTMPSPVTSKDMTGSRAVGSSSTA